MTITLTHDESLEYLSMKDKIAELIADLDSATAPVLATIDTSLGQDAWAATHDILKANAEDTSPVDVPLSARMDRDVQLAEDTRSPYPEGTTKASSTKFRWDTWEIDKLNTAMNPSSPKSRKLLTWLTGQLPDRTENAVRSKLSQLGGTVTDGIVGEAE